MSSPAQIHAATYASAMDIALRAHQALGCRGASRADLRYDDTAGEPGRLVLLEVNTQPGLTPTSLLPEQAAHCGPVPSPLCARGWWSTPHAARDPQSARGRASPFPAEAAAAAAEAADPPGLVGDRRVLRRAGRHPGRPLRRTRRHARPAPRTAMAAAANLRVETITVDGRNNTPETNAAGCPWRAHGRPDPGLQPGGRPQPGREPELGSPRPPSSGGSLARWW